MSKLGKSSQPILKEIIPKYSLEGLRLMLKLQYFGHLMGRADSLEKTLMLGKIEGKKRRGRQRMLAIRNSAAMNIGVHVSLSLLVSSVCMPSSGIAGS